MDIANIKNVDILAAASGTIKKIGYGYNGGLGNYIIVSHNIEVETLYAHLKTITVKETQQVNQGDIIGYMGATGHCIPTGAVHLHWEVHGADNPLN